MDLAANIAPEVDRLVFAIGPAIPDDERARLKHEMDNLGLDSLGYLPNFAEFFRGSGITTALAQTRMRYVPPDDIETWLTTLSEDGLIASDGGFWQATDRADPLLAGLTNAQTAAATALWSDHSETVDEINRCAAYVISQTTGDHLVAALHRSLDVPDNPFLALFHRMVTMRYIRQHDHAAAWEAEGLTAAQMVVMTELWHGGTVDEGSEGLSSLVEAGLATLPPGLTDEGRRLREAIEADTNVRNQDDIAVLGTTTQQEFLANLKSVPPH